MKKILFLALLLPITLVAQTVIVPNRYAFQKEDNQYQLNVLTKFLLEKQGFKTYMESEVPAELLQNPCDLLKADVKNESNMMTSKLQLVLNDCSNKTVFTSEIGKSREKEYKKSYQEALRNAFAGNALTAFKTSYRVPAKVEEKTPEPLKITMQPYIALLHAKQVEGGYELYNNTTNELEFIVRKIDTPNVFAAFWVSRKQYGVLEKDGSTFHKFTFYKTIEGFPTIISAQIQFN